MSKAKGAVAESKYRRIFSLVIRNNICLTVAFAESYRKTEPLSHIICVFFLIFGSRAIGYFLLLFERKVKMKKTIFIKKIQARDRQCEEKYKWEKLSCAQMMNMN
mgnify:CR=1 FL=1